MKFIKSTLAALAAVALISQPVAAQYGKEESSSTASIAEAEAQGGIVRQIKLLLTGGETPSAFVADSEGIITNLTDANYRDLMFNDEWIVTFCSDTSVPCADYYPTFLEAATILQNETNTKFASVWVDENPRLSTRFFVPARLPYVVYAKDGEFRQIPYVRNDTQFLVDFIEEEKYQDYATMSGPMSPTSTLAFYFEKYADFSEWASSFTAWMPKWMIYIISGSISGVIFNLFSGGSNYSSDPSKYPHLNADGTLKKTTEEKEEEQTKEEEVKTTKKSSKTSSSSSTKKKTTKKEKSN
ncbi:hypothetical protein BGZ94_009304 [Podila epigama]|nr:hypothetical protein BGZ94_009304 [Podila epigama]